MNYQDATSFSHIARPSWRGFYVDTARMKLVYHHADSPHSKEIKFVPTDVELAASDWTFVSPNK